MRKILLLSFLSFAINSTFAQNAPYWQQHVDYKMEVSMDVKNYQYKGKHWVQMCGEKSEGRINGVEVN